MKLGGTIYSGTASPMTGKDWRMDFGPAFEQLRNAKRMFDPTHVLAPGYEVF
jgi:cytokinin dehydrogenase